MINFDCRYYRASRPCSFNKYSGSECPACEHVSVYRDRVLIVKLDAIGDVLRSGSLLPTIVSLHDAPYVAWITRLESVELVSMMRRVDEVIAMSHDGLARIATGGWDRVYSLSNDMTSASLATMAKGRLPIVGYGLDHGVITPSNDAARNWLEMAAFDRLKRLNTRTYQAHMMEILGDTTAEVVPPDLMISPALRAAAAQRLAVLFPGSSRPRIAINVGSGGRWPKKMLNSEQILNLIRMIRLRVDADLVLVGGAGEVTKTRVILSESGNDARIQGALTETSISEFVALLDQMNVLFCGDTLALHIATAVGLPTVAIFGPTSAAEIPTFGGQVAKIFSSELDCLTCYSDCERVQNCMSTLDLGLLADMILSQMVKPRTR